MKLDRNANPDGTGKYALLNLRKKPQPGSQAEAAIKLLAKQGYLTFGNETPTDQFFVMKYKDQFTADGLAGYADAVDKYLLNLMTDEAMNRRMDKIMNGEKLTLEEKAQSTAHHYQIFELREYRNQIRSEVRQCARIAYKLPD